MDEYLDVLRRCPLFEGTDGEKIRAMLGCMGARKTAVKRGDYIFQEDGPADRVGIVLSGAAQVVRVDVFGNRTIQTRVGPGEMFGETFACAGVERLPVAVEAAADGDVLLIRLRQMTETCSNACEFHNRVVMNLLKVLAGKNLLLNRKMDITSRRTTREKLLAYLMLHAKKAGGETFEIPFDRQGLADYLGVERSALSAEIGRMRREGILESERSAFRLLAPLGGEG